MFSSAETTSSQVPLQSSSRFPVNVACDITLPHCSVSDHLSKPSEHVIGSACCLLHTGGTLLLKESLSPERGPLACFRHPRDTGKEVMTWEKGRKNVWIPSTRKPAGVGLRERQGLWSPWVPHRGAGAAAEKGQVAPSTALGVLLSPGQALALPLSGLLGRDGLGPWHCAHEVPRLLWRAPSQRSTPKGLAHISRSCSDQSRSLWISLARLKFTSSLVSPAVRRCALVLGSAKPLYALPPWLNSWQTFLSPPCLPATMVSKICQVLVSLRDAGGFVEACEQALAVGGLDAGWQEHQGSALVSLCARRSRQTRRGETGCCS